VWWWCQVTEAGADGLNFNSILLDSRCLARDPTTGQCLVRQHVMVRGGPEGGGGAGG
jgi:hypothetical protein